MSRSLTQKFIINREKYIETRQELTKRYEYQEKIPLLNKQYNNGHVKEPVNTTPEWVFSVDEINYVLKSLDHEMLIIHDLYHEHVTRPSFNDDFRHVSLINKTYTDITKKVRICYDKVTLVKNTYVNNKTGFNPTHRLLLQNAVSYIFKRICDISSNLGQQNKKYLDRLKSIHDASKEYFSVEMPQEDLVNEIAISMDQILVSAPNDQSNSFQQITNSVQDINNIVRDLAYMVNEQGSYVDRIDRHIEIASAQVEASLKKLVNIEKEMKFSKWKIAVGVSSILILILIAIGVFLRI